VALPVLTKQVPLILALFLFMQPNVSDADIIIGGKTTVVAQRGDCRSVIGARIEERDLAGAVDWVEVQNVVKNKTGIAEDVTR
jgi:hypothetical protein